MNNPAHGRQTVTTPGSLDAAIAHGEALLKTDAAAALHQAQVILKKDGRNPPALRIAAAAHRALGEDVYAKRAELLAIHEGQRYPALQQAAAEIQRGDFAKASQLAADHLKRYPSDLAALALSAESALGIGLTDKAIPLFRLILERAPDFTHAAVLLVNALMLSDLLTEAQNVLAGVLEKDPENLSLLGLQNRIYNSAGKFDACVSATARIIELAPENPDNHANHADALRFAGDKGASLAGYRRAVELAPDHGRAWWSTADLDASTISDAELIHIKSLISAEGSSDETQVNLNFAAGIAHHHREDFDEAFRHFAAGNAIREALEPFDAEEFRKDMQEKLALAKDLGSAASPSPNATSGPLPVFMVGMPRAGSTLLERMLASATEVQAMGELQISPHMVKRLEVAGGKESLNARTAALSQAARDSMGKWYNARLQEFTRDETRVAIDKMHMNWRHLPFILRILPEAKIIDIRRDGMDCCWSNFRTVFSRGHSASNSLAGIGHFYRTYVEFMDSMRALCPDRILLVQYEDLIDEPARYLASVCEFLGVSFDEAMLEFHKSKEPVATASSEQVRQPLNKRGLGAWRPYAAHLGDLRQVLGHD